MPPARRTRFCRYADGFGACPSIATNGDFCLRHAGVIEQAMERPPPASLGDLASRFIDGIFGVRPMTGEDLARMGADAAHHVVGARFPGLGGAPQPPPGRQPPPSSVRPGPASQPPRRSVPPEAIARRKKIIAAQGLLSLDIDKPLEVEEIRRARRRILDLYHTDGKAPDSKRETRLREVNEAAEFLIGVAREEAARRG